MVNLKQINKCAILYNFIWIYVVPIYFCKKHIFLARNEWVYKGKNRIEFHMAQCTWSYWVLVIVFQGTLFSSYKSSFNCIYQRYIHKMKIYSMPPLFWLSVDSIECIKYISFYYFYVLFIICFFLPIEVKQHRQLISQQVD